MIEGELLGGTSQDAGTTTGYEDDGVSVAWRPDAAEHPRALLRSLVWIFVVVMEAMVLLVARVSV